MAMGKIYINGKQITEQEFHELVRAEQLAKAKAIINAVETEEWYLYDGRAFEDYSLAEDYAKYYGMTYTDESIEPISKADLLEWVWGEDDIMTYDKWERQMEEENPVEYNTYEYEAHLLTMCVREAYGLI